MILGDLLDAEYVFPNPSDPFEEAFPEVYVYDYNLNNNYYLSNFVGIKIGDVNNTASPNNLLGSDVRTFDGEKTIQLQNQKVSKGETFTVDFRAGDFGKIEGYQFTLGFEKEAVEFVDVVSNLEGLSEANFGLAELEEGIITTSWNSGRGVDFEKNDILFSMTFVAKSAGEIADFFSINSRYTISEAYVGNELYDVKLAIENNNNTITNDFELCQNTPNPFEDETMISFYLPKPATVTLEICDEAGRVLSLMELEGGKGFNSKKIKRTDLSATGMLYYQVKTDNKTVTKKMILMD